MLTRNTKRVIGLIMLLTLASVFVYVISCILGSLLETAILLGGTTFIVFWLYFAICLVTTKDEEVR